MLNLRSAGVLIALSSLLAAPAPGCSTNHSDRDFSVTFTDCVETIGVGLVPTDVARTVVPPEFLLVGEGGPVTPIVVRTSRCGGIAVDGHKPNSGVIVQIGLVIVPPDFAGDINNYTLWYYTSVALLAAKLRELGIDAQHVQSIGYAIGSGDPASFQAVVPRPGNPLLSIAGTVGTPLPAGAFEANWWIQSRKGTIKMDTLVPDIAIGPANLLLSTPGDSALAGLIGGSILGFPIIQQYNAFASARLDVSLH